MTIYINHFCCTQKHSLLHVTVFHEFSCSIGNSKHDKNSKKYLCLPDMFWIFLVVNRTRILAVCFFSSEFLVQVTDSHRRFFFGHAPFHQGCLLPEGGFTTRAPGANHRSCGVLIRKKKRIIFNTSKILIAKEPQIHHAHVHSNLTYQSRYRQLICIVEIVTTYIHICYFCC